jgi:nucleoside-diphosphate-sugar epimerase
MRIPNVDKARKLLAWEPRVDLDDGLARTIGWYRDRRPVQSLAPSGA